MLMPDWQERHVPDIGVALVEVLAYTGDYLSYYQDAVATEAYLDTARQRISVRRHARLVDYFIHEGCNARAWLTVWTDQDLNDPALTFKDISFTAGPDDIDAIVFEPLVQNKDAAIQLFKAHNEIQFYTWGNQECCLPKGATSATLRDHLVVEKPPAPHPQQQYKPGGYYPPPPPPEPPEPARLLHLKVGDVLIFEEVIGPKTGSKNDADQTRRHAVRLTAVKPIEDPLMKEKPWEAGTDKPADWADESPVPLVEIEWSFEDALPFHLCLSARLPIPKCEFVCDISVARGNVILVDHGRTIGPEYIGQVGQTSIQGECACVESVMIDAANKDENKALEIIDVTPIPEVFRPILELTPLTFREPVDWTAPAALTLNQNPRNALPQILSLVGLPSKCPAPDDERIPEPLPGTDINNERWRWQSRRDLFGSDLRDRHFVVEIDNDGRARLRFGDDELGSRPQACAIFQAVYRVGNGPAGNVGADAITTVGWRKGTVSDLDLRPRNPLPASGGLAFEPVSEVRLFAPKAFLRQLERAVTADDYARLAERYPRRQVQRAGASLKWTGSWYAADVSIDPLGGETADPELFKQIKRYLHLYRRMGHDVEVELARYVPLKIEFQICVKPHYLRGHIEAALLDAFSNRVRQDGSLGLFHPDNLSFGEGIFLSKLVATAQAVTGVESARVTKLERLAEGPHGELEEGILKLGPLEVPQLDNDPNFPERGTLKITLRGGR
jgi:hypothetical protein